MAANQTALDRLIGWITPAAGVRRLRARAALGVATRGYEGAKTGRRTAGWVSGSNSANAEIGPSLVALRNRSRELIRDNPYAAKAARAFVGNAVGTGFMLRLSEGQGVWDDWCRECDADGQHDFAGLIALAVSAMFESGEVLIRLRWRRPEDGLAVPLQIQVIEPDYIDNLKNEQLPGGGWILNGVEFDAIGRRVAYWLYGAHPGDSAPILKSLTSRRVPASDIVHLYEKTRPGQVRGVPRMAPAMLRLRDLDDYEEAELVRKGIESCFAAFVTTENDDENGVTGTGKTGTPGRIETLAAGTVQYLKNGEDVTFGAPQHVRGYEDYVRQQLHAIAAGAGLTYELLTGDLSQVNYSSMRGGLLEFRRQIEQFRWLALVPMALDRILDAFLVAAGLSGALRPKAQITRTWTAPRWEWVDPVKDVAGELLEIAAGLKSWQEGVRGRGGDPAQNIKEIQEDQKRFLDAGIAILIDQLALGAAAAAKETQGATA